jgi:hypothetical protein
MGIIISLWILCIEHLFIYKCKLVITRKSKKIKIPLKVIFLCDTFVKGKATMYNLLKHNSHGSTQCFYSFYMVSHPNTF